MMINKLCVKVKHLPTTKELVKYTNNFPADAVFIVGLDFHTGYIIKENNKLNFLHSNYIGRKGVVKEKLNFSAAFQNSRSYVIGCLSENTLLLKLLKKN